MKYISTADAASALGVSERRVRQLIEAGAVKGAQKVGKVWLVPADKDGAPKVTLNAPGRPRHE